jgi:hypothetical protein
MTAEDPIQEQGVQGAATYTHCSICHRGFKRPKTVPWGPVCAKKHAKREEYWRSLAAPNQEADA